MEKAKTLLLSTDMSIQDICDGPHFGSRSFFAETFKEISGIPPAPITGAGGMSLFGGCLSSRYAAFRFRLIQARPKVLLTASRP